MEPELIYSGKGQAQNATGSRYRDTLPEYESPQYYFASDELADAVNTAIFLKQPLLITGAPGAGKTQLAHSIAWEFGLPLHIFNTKMNSAGTDLFYRYDSLLHFHDSHNIAITPNPRKYISYAALGAAILQSKPAEEIRDYLYQDALASYGESTRAVVLVDEIDKAPRDFPNDILYETERLSFQVKETDWKPFEVNEKFRPIILFTSNQERNLPDAFLRRCIFYYIPLPDKETLRSIVRRRLKPGNDGQSNLYDACLDAAMEIQSDQSLLKKPATAEVLNWIRVVEKKGITAAEVKSRAKSLLSTWPVLVKTKEDLERLQKIAPKTASA